MNDVQKLAFIVGRTVGLFPEDVRTCLEQSGVVVDAKNYNDEQLLEASLNGLRTSPKFMKNFSELVDSKQTEFGYLNSDSNESNFSGEGSFFNTTGSIFSTPFSTTPVTFGTPKSTTTSTGGLGASDYLSIGTTIANLGTSIWGSAESSKNAAKDRAAQLEMAKIQMEIAKLGAGAKKDELIAQQNMLAAQLAAGGKSNLPLYIGLGIGGVVILGLVVFLVVRGSGRNQSNQVNQ
jgi:hypothetical protein